MNKGRKPSAEFLLRKAQRKVLELSLNGGGLSTVEKEDFPIAEQFHSDASLEAVDRPAPNNSKNWQWTMEDESRFNLWDHDGCICVRRYAGERCLPECVMERHSGLTPGVMFLFTPLNVF
ncbi:uncharacterized protein TNCV_1464771 [Trichonephila clavipes]|nr:uncharacterized protein TNCV_1464771 [Trichonephila clavipes]